MVRSLLLVLAALACGREPGGPPDLVVLDGDLAPFARDFNAAAGKVRMLMILPPT